jgi:hypothetical protein
LTAQAVTTGGVFIEYFSTEAFAAPLQQRGSSGYNLYIETDLAE